MRILLVGEFSNSHNTLKKGLMCHGHNVTLISTGDGFKNYPSDILLIDPFNKGFMLFIKKIIKKLLGLNISHLAIRNQFFKKKDLLKGFDVVQLMTEVPIDIHPVFVKEIFEFLRRENKKIFVLTGGTDYLSVKYALEKKFKYSILTPYFEGKAPKKYFSYAFRYLTKPYKNLHAHIYAKVDGVIASDLDYAIPLKNHPKYLGMVPNTVDIDKHFPSHQPISNKVVIFLGINRGNHLKKGCDIFETALKMIQKEYPHQVEIIKVENLPYEDYINSYTRAHIVLDMVYAYDQGYNALEAMAKGKVVFTGAEQEWLEYYGLEEDTVAINALPEAGQIAQKLVWLLQNPEKITEIGFNARKFIEKEHHYLTNSGKYLKFWESGAQVQHG